MPDFKAIYAHHADQYDQLVAREDYQQNIIRALRQIRPLDGLDVVELGAGTGRLTRMLTPLARGIRWTGRPRRYRKRRRRRRGRRLQRLYSGRWADRDLSRLCG